MDIISWLEVWKNTSEISRVIVTNNILVKSREAFLLLSWIQVGIWTGKTLPPEMTSSYWLSGTHTGPFHPYLSGHADPAYFEDGSSSVCLVNIDTAHNCCQCSLLFGYTFPLGNLISAPWFPCKLHVDHLSHIFISSPQRACRRCSLIYPAVGWAFPRDGPIHSSHSECPNQVHSFPFLHFSCASQWIAIVYQIAIQKSWIHSLFLIIICIYLKKLHISSRF